MEDFGFRDRHNHPGQIERARNLRRNATPSERLLWSALKGKQLAGLKFRRQSPIGSYIADFVCLSARLIIEVDGVQHANSRQMDHDRIRTMWLRGQDFRVLRFSNVEVLHTLSTVLSAITYALEHRDWTQSRELPPFRAGPPTPPPGPRPQGAGEKP